MTEVECATMLKALNGAMGIIESREREITCLESLVASQDSLIKLQDKEINLYKALCADKDRCIANLAGGH